jgi:hypothetical protein
VKEQVSEVLHDTSEDEFDAFAIKLMKTTISIATRSRNVMRENIPPVWVERVTPYLFPKRKISQQKKILGQITRLCQASAKVLHCVSNPSSFRLSMVPINS